MLQAISETDTICILSYFTCKYSKYVAFPQTFGHSNMYYYSWEATVYQGEQDRVFKYIQQWFDSYREMVRPGLSAANELLN